MTTEIELAKQCGIAYYLTPEGTNEMHGTDRQIQGFAELVACEARKDCKAKCMEIAHNITNHDVVRMAAAKCADAF